MAMLFLANRAFPGNVAAATVDHGLRPEAEREAEMVSRFAGEIGVPHAIFQLERPLAGNTQSAAREARYDVLSKWREESGIVWLATAHHADDQLETVLMRLARGSGVAGLSGVRARRDEIIRPLLGFTKQECVEVCEAADVPFAHDPSNEDPSFDRVRMRKALQDFHLVGALAAVRTAAAMADADDALHWATIKAAETAFVDDGAGLSLNPQGLPREIRRRLVTSCLEWLEPGLVPRGGAMDRLLAVLESGGQTSIGSLLARGGDVWRFWLAPPRAGN